ncbi:MAG: oxygen-independent coproporphyrinogen III oxidase [Opitutaceae bacterium]|nr:oxygen-independent coproporphyrinogen III oxidase [Opitutaceae bacterium]
MPASAAPSSTEIDLQLIQKYSVPGPRYTSYPPATKFTTDWKSLDLEGAVKADNAAKGPLSLYFHLPFCETLCWFCGCNTIITRQRGAADTYVDDLAREMRITTARIDKSRPVSQIHFGGGTPTFLPPDTLRRLGSLIHSHFNLSPDCEFSVEVDPRRLAREHVEALQSIGTNRASLGVQDINPEVQVAVHRIQPHQMNIDAIGWLREHGFTSINLDLIYGLPLQTPESFSETIDSIIELLPDRLSLFSYAHVPWMKPAQKIFDDRKQLPNAEAKWAMFSTAHRKLISAGYVDIGLDHFARPDDTLAISLRNGTLQRNFQGYSTQAGTSLYGFGISAISSTEETYRQNHKTLSGWRAALDRDELPVERGMRLTKDDRQRRIVIMRIMCDRRIDYVALSRLLGQDFQSLFAPELAKLEDLQRDGLLRRHAAGFDVTPRGVPLLRVIAMRFDATLTPSARQHANTI